jgi:hypothetical protein
VASNLRDARSFASSLGNAIGSEVVADSSIIGLL